MFQHHTEIVHRQFLENGPHMSTVMIPILVCSSSVSSLPSSLISSMPSWHFLGPTSKTFLSPTKTLVLQKRANKLIFCFPDHVMDARRLEVTLSIVPGFSDQLCYVPHLRAWNEEYIWTNRWADHVPVRNAPAQRKPGQEKGQWLWVWISTCVLTAQCSMFGGGLE